MAEEICEVEFVRRNPRRSIVVFVRIFNQAGATVLAFPCRLDRGVTRTWPLQLDPTHSVEVTSGEPDEKVSARIRRFRPPGRWGRVIIQARKYIRAFINLIDKIEPEEPAARIKLWVAKDMPTPAPSVSIIIPTRDRADLLARAVETLFEQSDWPEKELVIVDNGSTKHETFVLFDRICHLPNVRIVRHDRAFNFSELVNIGARVARGDMLAIMNNDVETERRDWMTPLVAFACDPDVGVVGAKLLFGNGTLQHAGITLGIRGIAGHPGVGRAADDPGPYGILSTTRRVSAVTGACMITRRDVFERLGGMDENYVVELNDVDYCLRAGSAGFAIIYVAEAVLTHNEGSTRQNRPLREQEIRDRQLFIRQWGRRLIDDPYYPADLTLKDDSMAVLAPNDR